MIVTSDLTEPTAETIVRIIECKARKSIGAQVIRAEFGKAYDLKVTSYLIWSFFTPSERAIRGAKALGLDLEPLGFDTDMREELIGNAFRGLIHGGVTAAILDVTGGIAAFFSLRNKLKGQSLEKVAQRFSKFGTVDLRIDYLRPGVGKSFTSTGTILRTGNKVAVVRTELHNEENALIAVGTASYIVG